MAITGWGRSWIVSIITVHTSNRCEKNASSRSIISDRSWPAENAGPAPAITIARTESRAATSRSAAISSSISSSDSALRLSGRLRVIVADASSNPTLTFRYSIPGAELTRSGYRHREYPQCPATACSSIFAPNGSAPAWKVKRAGAVDTSANCPRHQSLSSE